MDAQRAERDTQLMLESVIQQETWNSEQMVPWEKDMGSR